MKKWVKRKAATDKVVKRRVKIVHDVWMKHTAKPFGEREQHRYEQEPGRLRKFNLRCGCRMCRIKDKKPDRRPSIEE